MEQRGVQLESDALDNIVAAQQRPMTGAAGTGRAYSYTEYFTRATWDKTLPPIGQVQIIPDRCLSLAEEQEKPRLYLVPPHR